MAELDPINLVTDPDELINNFFRDFPESYTQQEEQKIRAAWSFLIEKTGSLKRKCGKPYCLHPMRVARILAEKNLGADCIIAGLFHNILEVDSECLSEIEEKFGKDVSVICSGTPPDRKSVV